MTQQIINTGTLPNDGTGDVLRTAFLKTSNNFTELYTHHSNTTANIVILRVAANTWANNVGYAGNAYVNVSVSSVNAYANLVGISGNTYANLVGISGNTYANLIGDSANNYAGFMSNSVNSWANTVGVSGNAYANVVGISGNTYANLVGGSANNYAGAMANAANAYAQTTYLPYTGGTITSDLVVSGNLTISGTTTYANTQTLLVGDAIFIINSDMPASAAPSENAGLEVNRGSSANVSLLWNESSDTWTLTNDGTIYYAIATNNYVNVSTLSANNYAGAMANAVNAWANTVGTSGNAYADVVGISGNAYANLVGTSGNAYADVVGDASNTYTEIVSISANNYAGYMVNTAADSANNYAGAMANSINAWSLDTFTTLTNTSTLFDVANAAFNYANIISYYANSDNVIMLIMEAQGFANDAVNTSISALETANATYDTANAARDSSNSIYLLTNSVSDLSNSVYTLSNVAFDKANSANVLAYNTGIGANNYAGVMANSANAYAESVGVSANVYAGVMANAANAYAASLTPDLSPAFSRANAAFDKANSANVLAYNTGIGANNYAGVMANSANAYAAATYLPLTGNSTIDGSLTVTKDLYISGNAFITNSTTVNIGDSLLFIAGNNTVSDVSDIGLIGSYVNAGAVFVRSGIFRESDTKEWYIFQDYDTPLVGANIDHTDENFKLSVLNADIRTSNLNIGGANAIVLMKSTFDTTNAAFEKANSIPVTLVSNTAPVSPKNGDLWWSTTYGRLFLYYNDGTSSQWVEAAPDNSVSAVYDIANAAFSKANTGGISVNSEISSASTYYPMFTSNTTGAVSYANVSSTKLYFVPSTGTLSATAFNTLSDIRLKDNVSDFDGSSLVHKLHPVTFTWRDTTKQSYGVIAQELEQVMPELVETNDDGLKSVSYIPMIALLIDTNKKLLDRVSTLETEIEEIKKKL